MKKPVRFGKLLSTSTLALCLLLQLRVTAQEVGSPTSILTTLSTMSEVTKVLKSIAVQIPLRANPANTNIDLFDDRYLLHLLNHLDLNYIGAGKNVRLNREAVISFILNRLEQGDNLNTIGLEMVAEFERSGFTRQPQSGIPVTHSSSVLTPDVGGVKVGGLLVTEAEYHQEPDGEFRKSLGLNQVRIYFASEINPADKFNNISLLAEFNPVPEEVMHHIDEVAITRNGISDTVRAVEREIEELVPFEQLYMRIQNVANSGWDVTLGQFRNPFGLWSDFTSHRNLSATKNNLLVNGFALKKIELGLLFSRDFNNGFNLRTAIVHGRLGRTANLPRDDFDEAKDFVASVGYGARGFKLGASAYLAEFSLNRRVAYGADFSMFGGRWSLSGELVYQKNKEVNQTFGTNFNFSDVSSVAGYINFDFSLTSKFHFYGMYEAWRYMADGENVNDPAIKIFHGIRYHVHPQLRWIIFEFGRILHNDFDDGKFHSLTQMELTF